MALGNPNLNALLAQLSGEPLVNRSGGAVLPNFDRAPTPEPARVVAVPAKRDGGGGMSKKEKWGLAITAILAGLGGLATAKARGPFEASGMGKGIADAVEEMEETRHRRQLDAHRMRMDVDRNNYARSQDEERRRQWEADHSLRASSQKSLEAGRTAEADKDRRAIADAERIQREQGEVFALMGTPEWAKLTQPQRVLRLKQVGLQNLPETFFHSGIETPDEHGAHVKADDAAKFGDWQRRSDYTEQQRRSRPARLTGRIVGADDPSLPLGSQRYALEIAQKHGDDFESAQAEAAAYLNDPQTQRDHPRLSPDKFMGAVRRGMSRPTGRRDELFPPANTSQGGGRGAGPGVVRGRLTTGGGGQVPLHQWSDGSTRAYPETAKGAATSQQPAQARPAPAASAPVKMIAPDGRELMVPADKVEEARKRGAKIAGDR